MPRSLASYRSSVRNKAREEAMTWVGVPTKRAYPRERSETYQPNGQRERARRAKRMKVDG